MFEKQKSDNLHKYNTVFCQKIKTRNLVYVAMSIVKLHTNDADKRQERRTKSLKMRF